jgi:protein TonB
VVLHAVAVVGLWLARTEQTTEPVPLSVSVLSEAPPQQTRPAPVEYQPKENLPLLHTEMPEINLADDAPSTAPVMVSTVATAAEPAPPAPTQPRFDADYLNNPKPRYPVVSSRLREEGVVLLHVYVSPNGEPDVVELKQSSGSSRLDESALAAVRQWRFVPARRGNEAVAAWVIVPVAFSLGA